MIYQTSSVSICMKNIRGQRSWDWSQKKRDLSNLKYKGKKNHINTFFSESYEFQHADSSAKNSQFDNGLPTNFWTLFVYHSYHPFRFLLSHHRKQSSITWLFSLPPTNWRGKKQNRMDAASQIEQKKSKKNSKRREKMAPVNAYNKRNRVFLSSSSQCLYFRLKR